MAQKVKGDPRVVSRRQVLAPLGIGIAAAGFNAVAPAAFARPSQAKGAAAQEDIPPIRISPDQINSLATPPATPTFKGSGMTGADVFATLCKAEGLAAFFCCPGNYRTENSMAEIGIPTYGMRNELGAVYAADGFARATGEVVAVAGFAAPGLTVMVNGLAAAKGANSPILVTTDESDDYGGRWSPEEAHRSYVSQQSITKSLTKYQGRVSGADIYQGGATAFRQLKTGVPAPVHLQFGQDSMRYTDPSQLQYFYDKSVYRSESRPTPGSKEIARAVDMISRAERPLLIAGQGVFYRKAWNTLLALAEKHEMAVCCSGPTRGHFPMDHRLAASTALGALMSADLVIFVGQYLMPRRGSYRVNPDAKAIQVDPEPDMLGAVWPAELTICSDAAEFLEALAAKVPAKTRPTWVAELAAARKQYQGQLDEAYRLGLKYSRDTGFIHPAVLGKELSDFLYRGDIDPKQTVVGFGGFTSLRFVPPRLQYNRPGQGIVGPYGFLSIGPDLTQMLGAAVAVKRGVGPQAAYKGAPVVVQTTDSGAAYCLLEMSTAAKYRLPLVALVYNNNSWGTWTFSTKGDLTFSDGNAERALQLHLYEENLRYDLAAEALGCRGEYARTPEELRAALKRSYDHAAKESLPTLINVQAIKEFTSAKLYPAPVFGYNGPGTGALI